MYKCKSLKAGQLPREHLSFLQNLLLYYHNIFEARNRWRPKRAWMNVAPVASMTGDIKIYQCLVIKK